MSQDNIEEEVDASCCCASCGVVEIDDIKLEPCDDCDLVKYCGDDCKGNHKSEHEEACKKRAAELRDELLFKQPEENFLGDCPICSLPMPIDLRQSSLNKCCSKVICKGCAFANVMREMEMRLALKCPFCREPLVFTDEENAKLNMKRIEMNDPAAICYEGGVQFDKGDYTSAFEYWTKAAELGYADAYCKLAVLYDEGLGTEKDEGKYFLNMEEAAIRGHPGARHNLGIHEENNGNIDRAVKHWIIAATHGLDKSMKELMAQFREGYVSKEDLASTLRAQKAAVDATKSPQREFAENFEQFKKEAGK